MKPDDQYVKMTATPVPGLILKLSVPSIITMLVNNIYNLVDTAFVGRLGTSASGAVGIVFGFMTIIQAFGFMLGQGSGSTLSRALGRRDKDLASRNASAGFFSALFFGTVISILGFIFLDPMVRFLGSTETIVPYAKEYITYILIASPFMCSGFVMNNILRYEGKAVLGMIGLMTGAVLNIIGDPILMFGLGLGVTGAGLSTAISQIISWGVLLYMFLTHKTGSRISLKLFLDGGPKLLPNIAATGFPSLLRQGLTSITTVLLNSICAGYGDAAVAAMSIVSRIVFFAFSVALGIGQGFQPVSAFNYGAGKYSRIRKGFRFTMMMSEALIVVACLILFIFSGSLIGIFRDDPEVIRIGVRALRLQAVATMTLPPCMSTEMLLQSTGRRLQASLISAVRSGILFIPLLLILPVFRGLSGVQEAQPLSLVLATPVIIPFIINFFKGLPEKDKEEEDT